MVRLAFPFCFLLQCPFRSLIPTNMLNLSMGSAASNILCSLLPQKMCSAPFCDWNVIK